jgi:hypothetical protein
MEKSPWEPGNLSASQEYTRLLWNRKFITFIITGHYP